MTEKTQKKDWRHEPLPGLQPCANCGQPVSDHHPANYADGPLIGRRLEVCPSSVFKARLEDKTPDFLS